MLIGGGEKSLVKGEITARDRWVAYLAILLFAVPSLLAGLLGTKFFPFNDYNMFSWSMADGHPWFEVYAIPRQGEPFLMNRQEWLFPVGFNGVNPKMAWILEQDDSEDRIQAALAHFYRNYEAWLDRIPDRGHLKSVELHRVWVEYDADYRMVPAAKAEFLGRHLGRSYDR